MDIKQEIAELKSKLAELEAKANEPLDCYFGKGYAILTNKNVVDWHKASDSNDYAQIRRKETAEVVVPLVQIQRALINFKCEHDPVFDSNSIEELWSIERNMESEDYGIDNYSGFHAASEVWFSTEELAQSALDMLKRRNLV